MKFLALVGLLALTACGTYAVRVYDYGNAERGEAAAEASAPAEQGEDKGDKGDKGDRDNDTGKDSDAGKGHDGRERSGKDKGRESDND